jgi:2-phosphosulfolactate phosphatase
VGIATRAAVLYRLAMRVDVALLPTQLTDELLIGRSVVVFDVLRATTSIVTAISSGATRVRVFADHDSMRQAARVASPAPLLAGETRCVRPDGFDLGNSPREYASDRVAGRDVFLSTTNGTRAIHASRLAARVFIGALVNAQTVARQIAQASDDITLVCAGTQGQVADEDRLGAGAVIERLYAIAPGLSVSTEATACRELFRTHQSALRAFLRTTPGGQNVVDAGLERDIIDCAAIDRHDVAPQARWRDDAVFVEH